MPRVTVVIPSYNCAEFIETAIRSVLGQTTSDYETIVVDDGSTDDTAKVIGPYLKDPRLHYFYEENRGLPGARNAGAKLSQAEYVAFLDADDALEPEALKVMADELDRSQAGWCLIDVWRVKDGVAEISRSNMPADNDLLHHVLRGCPGRAVFYRRKEFVECGMYDEEMRCLEDWELYIRLIEHKVPVIYIARPLYRYTWREGSIITRRRAMLEYTIRLYKKHHKRMADAGDAKATSIYAFNMWGLGREFWRDLHDWRRAVQCCTESIAYERNVARLAHPVVHWSSRLLRSTGNEKKAA